MTDEETGMYYYGARYYEPRLSLWMSTDPMETITPNYSTYCYTVNNPINAIDLDGNSTHTDKKGNVIAVYEDGYLGIFSHSNDVIKKAAN